MNRKDETETDTVLELEKPYASGYFLPKVIYKEYTSADGWRFHKKEQTQIDEEEMTRQIKPLFAKYAGSIDSKLNIKLSEEEIKEQEQEFERIKSFMANHDIPRLHSILFTQTESNNET